MRLAVLALAVLSACGGEPAPPKLNVLLISIDTLRADHLGCYGNTAWGASPSPHIDGVAQEGVRLDAYFAPRGQTHPSLSAMITGKYPITTGLRENRLSLLDEHRTHPIIWIAGPLPRRTVKPKQ